MGSLTPAEGRQGWLSCKRALRTGLEEMAWPAPLSSPALYWIVGKSVGWGVVVRGGIPGRPRNTIACVFEGSLLAFALAGGFHRPTSLAQERRDLVLLI